MRKSEKPQMLRASGLHTYSVMAWLWLAWLSIGGFGGAARGEAAEAIPPALLRERAAQSLGLIQRSAAEYLKQRECFSCHHQAMAIMTCMEARQRGLAIDQENLAQQVERTIEHLRRGEEQYRQGQGQGGKVDTAGYALLSLAAAGWPADATTEAVTEYLLKAYAKDRRWICSSNRPPTESNDITTSALALKGLKAFAAGPQVERAGERIDACAKWLSEHPPEDNEQRVFALLAAQSLDRSKEVASMKAELLATQRDDGGWAQTSEMDSDAYATGTALYALAQAGVASSDEAYQRGLRYLIDSQLPDGSWHVTTRSRPIQKYFESGFPHGVDQFISMSASSWSTLAILLALPRDEAHLAGLPKLPWDPNRAASDAHISGGSSPGKSAARDSSAEKATAEASAADLEFFEREVRPLLVEKCTGCHGPKKQSGDLRVDSRVALLRGGESGPAIVPGEADRSLMIRAVRREGELEMPPDDPLGDHEVAKLRRWIELGAPWPKGAPPADGAGLPQERAHWAFQPVTPPQVPDVRDAQWTSSPVDRFILSRLEQHELTPASKASRRELLRRVSYDLTGLPPTAEQQDDFASDSRPDAYERVVDRLLASPRLGEQWGRHWLDVARYSDTKGYVYAREERFFVHAAAYRDWVIDALATDLPFDRFVLLQLAADQVAPDDRRAQAAMGFLTLGRRFLGVTHDIIDDRIDVVTRGLMGLTVACARCHDHKFDPIPTADYYSLYGVFANSVEQRVRLAPAHGPDAAPDEHAKPDGDAFETELAKRNQQYRERLESERQIAAQRVRDRFTEYLLAQLELEKYPAEGFDIIIGKDDLVPAHVRRVQAYLIAAAERDDPIFYAWRRYAQLAAKQSSEGQSTEGQSSTGKSPEDKSSASDFGPSAAVVTAELAELPKERLNRWVARQFSTPPESMRQVAERYGQLFAKLKDKDQQFEVRDEVDRLALEELVDFWEGPRSPCIVPDEDIVSIEQFFDSKTCEALWKLQGEVDRWINSSNTAPPFATILSDRREIVEPHIFRRGNPRTVGPKVARQFLTLFRLEPANPSAASPSAIGESSVNTSSVNTSSVGTASVGASAARPTRAGSTEPGSAAQLFQVMPFEMGSGRRELAEAIVQPRNPLTARVWTNRVWQHLFGQGLVRTTSDFGLRADAPSHPELLDWMASEFVARGQSTKELIRRLVFSSTYQQSGALAREDSDRLRALELDPENKLLWHTAPKRMSFEQQRDTWLMVAGQLDFERGGRARPLFGEADNRRRTIYGLVDRQFLPGVMRVFDFANPDLHTPQRSETTVPQQALFELNHAFAASVASGAARATDRPEAESTSDARIERMFRLILGRRPSAIEISDARAFLDQPADAAPSIRAESLDWQYGIGQVNVEAGIVEGFARLPYFAGSAWQGGAKWPDSKLGWAQLTAEGGHAGNDLQHAVVRRWIAPQDGTVQVRSQLHHDVKAGDGVRGWVVASRGGVLHSAVVHNGTVDFNVDDHQVRAGDTLDFVVDFHANLNNDQFRWSPQVTMSSKVWQAERDFSGPPPKLLGPWEQLAQVLLLSNELMFVD